MPNLTHQPFIPEQFNEGQSIDQIILISDVDGVIRDSIEAKADPRIIQAMKSFIAQKNIDVTFISGTPVENDLTVETWRRGNVPLNQVFGSDFTKELTENVVSVYGVLGGHRMKEDGSAEIVDEYSPAHSWELCKLLVHAFLKEVLKFGNHLQKNIAKNLQQELDSLKPSEINSSNLAPTEFQQIVYRIREHLDPHFRLVAVGSLIETQTSNPPWSTQLSYKWLSEEINNPNNLIARLPQSQKKLATGVAKRGNDGYNYFIVSKTNKGLTTHHHLKEKLKQYPKALIVTIGDTQVDFPMHKKAHLSFHVGIEQVWKDHSLPHCMMVRNENGEDCQHVEGTLKILELLAEAVGKSFYDFKYIPKRDDSGKWNYYSLSEITALKNT